MSEWAAWRWRSAAGVLTLWHLMDFGEFERDDPTRTTRIVMRCGLAISALEATEGDGVERRFMDEHEALGSGVVCRACAFHLRRACVRPAT